MPFWLDYETAAQSDTHTLISLANDINYLRNQQSYDKRIYLAGYGGNEQKPFRISYISLDMVSLSTTLAESSVFQLFLSSYFSIYPCLVYGLLSNRKLIQMQNNDSLISKLPWKIQQRMTLGANK